MAMLVPGDRDVCIKVGNRGWGTDPVGFSGKSKVIMAQKIILVTYKGPL